jgi:hypothetical protein
MNGATVTIPQSELAGILEELMLKFLNEIPQVALIRPLFAMYGQSPEALIADGLMEDVAAWLVEILEAKGYVTRD